jgi:Lysylphosphatidylglycerol synthase TM region
VVAFPLTHTLGQVVFWLLTLPLAYALLPRTRATTALLAATGGALLLVSWLLLWLPRSGALERLPDALRAVPLLRRAARALERRRPALAAVDAQLAALATKHPKRLAGALAAEVAERWIAALEFLLIARAAGYEIGYGAAAVAASFSQLVMNVLFFIPLSLGSKEGSLYLVFRLLGFGTSLGVSVAVVSRLRELTWIAIGLALGWASGARERS